MCLLRQASSLAIVPGGFYFSGTRTRLLDMVAQV